MKELAGLRILLVEDEPFIAMAQKSTLQKLGCTVVLAPNGEGAVAAAAETEIDLVLMDVDLGPGMDGIEAAKRILAERDLPLIFVSNHREVEIVQATEEVTSYGYVLKSAGDTVLRASMKMALRLFKAKRELQRREEILRTTLYSIGDGVIATDAAGRVDRMNAVAEALCGWTEAEAAGRPLAEVFRILNESSRAEVASPVDRVLREGAVVGLANHTVLVSRDGAERPIADSAAPIRLENQLSGVVLVFRDQSEARESQKALEESERQFRTIFEVSTIGIVQVETAKGRILTCNARYAEITGYSLDELRSMPFSDLTHPEDREEDWKIFSRAVAAGTTYRNEKRYMRKDGGVVWVRLNAAFLRDDEGRPVRSVAVAEDITEQKNFQRRKDEEQALYLRALDKLMEGCQIIDREFRYRYLNEAALVHARKPAGELLGRTMAEAYPGIESTLVYEAVLRCRDRGEESGFMNRFVYEDGRVAWFDLAIRPIEGGFLILSLDISARKLAEADLDRRIGELGDERREKGLLAELVKRSTQPLVVGYADGTMGLMNAAFAELTGYSEEELRKLNWIEDLTPPEWRDSEAGYLERLGKTREPVRYEKEYLRKDGKRIPVELLVQDYRNAEGAVEFNYAFVTDISERKRNRARLEEALREKDVLYQELQHRVKNSLTQIASVIELERGAASGPEATDRLRAVSGRVQVLSQLYTLLGQNAGKEIRLVPYLQGICGALDSMYGSDAGRVRFEFALEDLRLDIKRATNLGLVVNELATNALKYAFRGRAPGTVRVVLGEIDEELRLDLSDDGAGLPAGKRPEGNPGLGFMLIEELVRQMGGRFEVRSGPGASFRVSIPR